VVLNTQSCPQTAAPPDAVKDEINALEESLRTYAPTTPQSEIASLFSGTRYVLACAGIRRLVVHIKAIQTDILLHLEASLRA
jgi:hypothetical protein